MLTEPDPLDRAAEVAFPDEVRRRRVAAGLSQAELANRVGYSREYVSRAERASKGLASAELARALDNSLGAQGHLVALHASARQSRTARRGGSLHRVPDAPGKSCERTAARGTAAGTDAVPRPEPLSGDPEHDPDGEVASSAALCAQVAAPEIDPLTVADVEGRVDALARGYFRTGHEEFRSAVIDLRQRVLHLLMIGPASRQRRQLYAMLAALTGMLAESAFALGRPTDVHCTTALALAEEAEHDGLAGWIRGTQAQIALHTGNPSAAVRFATAGQHAPRGSTALVRSSSYLARASARIGDRATAERAWRSAQRAWNDLQGGLTESIFSLNPEYLTYCELTMTAWLGGVKEARRLTDTAAHMGSAPTVGMAIGRIDTGLLHLHLGEVNAAVDAGYQALAIGERRLTTPLRDRFGDLMTALSSYDAPEARGLRERWKWISA